ncbi:MBL fold metallo-hydrolase RNA specificity domain-containing protein [Allosphingosinicella vermicomposti]|uniref:MBL fold metallo-hydrolase RNA specificity domain-containing protein n=1 Tax=Allosphingosinicella vermicomposti TaxID=614671 RepID=UPI00315A57AE
MRAHIRRLDSYSAHADRSELLHWIAAREPIRGSLFLAHGEQGAIEALRNALPDMSSVIVPEIGEAYELAPAAPARRLRTGRRDLRSILSRDWQNEYADLAVNLKSKLQDIDAERRAEALARVRAVLDEYAAFRSRKRDKTSAREAAAPHSRLADRR